MHVFGHFGHNLSFKLCYECVLDILSSNVVLVFWCFCCFWRNMPSRFSSFTTQNQLTRAFSWELMSYALGAWCGNHKVNWGQNQLAISISTLPCLWLRAHVMCSGGLVSSPQGEPGSKPLYNNIILFRSSLIFFVCLQSCLKARSSVKTHQRRKMPKRNPRGGDGRRERGCSQPHMAPPISLFYH